MKTGTAPRALTQHQLLPLPGGGEAGASPTQAIPALAINKGLCRVESAASSCRFCLFFTHPEQRELSKTPWGGGCLRTARPVGYLRAVLATAQPPNTPVHPLLGFHHYRALPGDGHGHTLHCAFPLPVCPRLFQYHQVMPRQTGSGADLTVRVFPDRPWGLCPCRFSTPEWVKPQGTSSGFIVDPVLSWKLDWRPSKVPCK